MPAAFRHEIGEVRWLPLEEAPQVLAYGGEREMVARAVRLLAERDRMIGVRCRPTP